MHTDKEIKADNSILRDKRVNKYLCSKRVSEIPDFFIRRCKECEMVGNQGKYQIPKVWIWV